MAVDGRTFYNRLMLRVPPGWLLPLLALACNGGSDENTGIPSSKATKIDPATTGTIRGEVLFAGTVPARKPLAVAPECRGMHAAAPLDDSVLVKDGRLQNTFVVIRRGLEKFVFATPTAAVEIDQKGCLFLPRVSGVMTHQKIAFLNSDPTLHNVKGSRGGKVIFDRSMTGAGSRAEARIHEAGAERVTLQCELHGWMCGVIGVADHPFFAITGEDGAWSWSGVPAGEYVIEAWHEKFGTQQQTVRLAAGQAAPLTFTFSAR